jgi:DMSO/TMAO reductase YedYZ heme-binding membrane subunit
MIRMQARREALGGPRLVAVAALGMAALCAGTLALHGDGEDGLRALARVTARVALVIFVGAYAAAPLRRAWRAAPSAWLLRNRRFVGLSFAVAHGFHALAVLALVVHLGDGFAYDPVSLAGGSTAYLFVVLLAATSSDRAVAALGPARWRRLHRVGIHAIWTVFAFTELPTALVSPLHFALASLLVAAAGLRAAAALARRRAPRSTSPARA